MARRADAVFYNGKVYTLDAEIGIARAVAISGGRIIAVGSDAEIKGSAPRGCDKYDLGGKVVVPGFNDSHTHFVNMGVNMMNVDLMATASLESAVAKMAAGAKKVAPGEWVIGSGWSESRWGTSRFMNRDDLDSCCPDNPAVAHRICMHMCSVNSKAIEQLGLNADIPGVETGAGGRLTGIVKESAVNIVRDATRPDRSKNAKALALATKRAHSLGVTSVQDNGVAEHLAVYQAAERSGKLGVRVSFNVPAEELDSMVRLSLSSGLGSDLLRIGGVKLFCDGALGARTAALSEPYADDPGNSGMFMQDGDEMDEVISRANKADIQLVVHAIGDMGIEAVISSIEGALAESQRRDHRHRIEHLELPSPQHLRRMRRSRIIASMQPNFVGEWGGTNGMYYARLGEARARRNNPFKEVLASGVRMVFGSDCMPFSPLYGLVSAVNAPHEAQRVTVDEAVAAYTREAAYASFEEASKGTISVGKHADMAVLSSDPFADPGSLAGTVVLKTVVGGEIVYERPRARG
ncbi:MAG: amidohydrolase [Candidatus Thermoplasmatota archaeon]